METIGDLGKLPQETLTRHLGVAGEHLLHLASGRDKRRVVPEWEAKSYSHEETFASDQSDRDFLDAVLCDQSSRVARRLRRAGVAGRVVAIKLRYGDFTTITRRRKIRRATSLTEPILEEARRLFDANWNGRPLRLLGVGVSEIEIPESDLSLFPMPEEENRRRIIMGLALLLIIPALIGFAVQDLAGGRVGEGSVLMILAGLLVTGLLMLKRLKSGARLFRLIGGLLGFMVLYYVWWSGEDYTFLWMYPFPLAVLFLLGSKEGLVWVIAVLSIVAVMLLFPRLVGANDYEPAVALRFFVSLFIVAVLSYGFESLRESYYQRLASEHAELLASQAEVNWAPGRCWVPSCSTGRSTPGR